MGGRKTDEEWMAEALVLARAGLEADECPVGCIVVDADGERVASGHNETNLTCNATAHAELVAAARLRAERGLEDLRGATVYVTVEPCVMCAAALALLRVSRVVFGCHNPRFGGCGSVLRVNEDGAAGSGRADVAAYPVRAGVRAADAVALLQRFYERDNPFIPDGESLS